MPLCVVLIELRSTAKVFAGYLSWIVLAEVYIQNCAKLISLYFSKSLFGITTFFPQECLNSQKNVCFCDKLLLIELKMGCLLSYSLCADTTQVRRCFYV